MGMKRPRRYHYLAGRIYKIERGHYGAAHRWVAPDPVVRAVAMMERLLA